MSLYLSIGLMVLILVAIVITIVIAIRIIFGKKAKAERCGLSIATYEFLKKTENGRKTLEISKASQEEIKRAKRDNNDGARATSLEESWLSFKADVEKERMDAESAAKKKEEGNSKQRRKRPKKIISKLFFPLRLWIPFWIVLLLIPISILIASLRVNVIKGHFPLFIIGAVVISVVLIIISLAKAWTQNTEKDELVVNLFEKYIGTVIRAGLLFPFPFFGWIELFETEMEDDDLFLFQFPDENGKMKIGNFDLKNASLPLLAKVFFRVIDSYKFVYGHKNATQAMLEYVEAFMRRVLIYHEEGQPDRLMNLEEAMMLKSAELIDHFSSVPDGEETVNEKDSSRKLSEKDFILQNWGIEIFSIKIIDFEMTDGQRADFDKVLTAQKNRETALINADIEFIQKEGVARGIERLALAKEVELSKTANGFANSVKVLVESGMRPDQALRHFQEMAKWQNPNSTHVTGNTGFVGMGAGFENGRNTYNRNRQPRENN